MKKALTSILGGLVVVTIAIFGVLQVVPHQYLPRFLFSETEQAHLSAMSYIPSLFNDVKMGQSTDPSMALRMTKYEIDAKTISYADLSTTKEEFGALIDRYSLNLSKAILLSARAGTYRGTDFRLTAARSDLEAFGYTLADIGFTEEEYNSLLKKYQGKGPTDSASLRVQMSTY